MWKTNPLLLETMPCSIIKPQKKEISSPLYLEKLKKWQKFSKNLKKIANIVSFCMFVFVVPKHRAHKMVITGYFVSQKAFIIFQKLQRKTKTKK